MTELKWKKLSEGPWSKRRKHQAVAWNDKLLLFGGFDGESALDLNDVWSWDGQTWTLVTGHASWSGRDGHCVVVLNNIIYLVGGTDDPHMCKNDVWKSDDGGKFWIQINPSAAWPERWQHAACSHNGYIYISGGWGNQYFNDVWRSENGITWTSVCLHCPWKPRMFHSFVSFKNTLYILAGNDGKEQLNDVWASSDGGFTWIEVCNVAAWDRRQGHATAITKDHIYVMGGFGGSNRRNDVWKSSDCAHWTLVSKTSEWSPRQGHACVAYRNSLCLLGGFDESGYINDMYSYELFDPIARGLKHEADGLESKHIVTVSMECVLSCVDNLQKARMAQQLMKKNIDDVVRLVNSSVNYNPSVGNDVHELPSYILGQVSSQIVDSTSETEVKQMNSTNQSEAIEPLEYFKLNFSADTDDSDFSASLASISIDPDDAHPPSGASSTMFSTSSAHLRESMERQQKQLISIQRGIRASAEIGDNDAVSILLRERSALASSSLYEAKKLCRHTKVLKNVQTSRQFYLEKLLRQLEKIERVLVPNENERPRANVVESSFQDWNDVVGEFETLCADLNDFSVLSNEAIVKLQDALRDQALTNSMITEWIDHTLPRMENTSIISEKGKALSQNVAASESYDNIIAKYENQKQIIDAIKMDVKISIDREMKRITDSSDTFRKYLIAILEKGTAFVQYCCAQNRSDVMEISAMTEEVDDWLLRLNKLSNTEELQNKCNEIVKESSNREEQLIKLEDERIDLKSALEKASFRRQGTKANSKLAHNDSSGALNELDQLKEHFAIAEKRVRDARKDLRKWYRGTRKFAIEYAPELLLYIPDLRSAGSILGDGGFAEKTKLPRRRFEEYENVRPLNADDADGKRPSSGRHLLLRASYDNEEVVLKGFVMNEGTHRQGLEREVSILSRLRNECIICPNAIVEDFSSMFESSVQVTIFIEYPFYNGGNLSNWLRTSPRKPWDLQSIARQLLYGLCYLHDHGVIHKDIKPSNVLLHDDGRVVLTDFELSKDVALTEGEDITTSIAKTGTRGFMAPEVEAGETAIFASDMYSYGVLLYYMHFPNKLSSAIAGNIRIPSSAEPELTDLLEKLLSVDPALRPTANMALLHPFFRLTFAEKLLRDGEVVEQDRKLEAVRNMLHRCRHENRTNIEKIVISRNNLVGDVLSYFKESPLEKIKSNLHVSFVGEPGVDEGGLLTELFTMFYDLVFQGEGQLFEGPQDSERASSGTYVANDFDTFEDPEDQIHRSFHSVVLPSTKGGNNPTVLQNLRAFGRAMVKTLYEGRRIGSRLCPSVFKFITSTNPNMRDLQAFDRETARSLQWTLATIGVEGYGLHFESVNAPDLGLVNDSNKVKFVSMKIQQILVDSRKNQLLAIKAGFTEAMNALSEEASPFLSLLSHADWRVLLCGETAVNGSQIVSCLKFQGFPAKSNVPQWLKEIILSSSDDHLRQFLVFATGSPSIPTTFSSTMLSSSRIEITVRCQSRSNALPIAHTCFFQLDIPDYRSKEILQSKLIYAIQNTNTFEIV